MGYQCSDSSNKMSGLFPLAQLMQICGETDVNACPGCLSFPGQRQELSLVFDTVIYIYVYVVHLKS